MFERIKIKSNQIKMKYNTEELTQQEFMILQMNDFEPVPNMDYKKLTARQLKRAYIVAAEELGFSEGDIFGEGKRRRRYLELKYLRYFFYKTLRDRRYTLQDIANFSGGSKAHDTVLHSLRTNNGIICNRFEEIKLILKDKGLL